MTATSNPHSPPHRTRARLVVVLLFALFLAPFLIAVYLYYTGWQPSNTRNLGTLLQPATDLRAVNLRNADGSTFVWDHTDHTFRVVVAPPANCGDRCTQLADKLRRIWIGVGRQADRVQVLWIGAPPPPMADFGGLRVMQADPALQAQLADPADPQAIPVYVADPTGYLILRYASGFDPSWLRKDLVQLLK